MTPYPTDVDIPKFLMDAVAFLRGNGDKAAIVHDAWDATGFALGKYLPYQSGITMGAEQEPAPDFARPLPVNLPKRSTKQMADAIEAELNKFPKGDAPDFSKPDWQRMLAFALQVADIIKQLFMSGHL